MISKRLKTIASLVDIDAKVIDIGTDHAYIPIYLAENNITTHIWATDISQEALNFALNNIKTRHLENIIKTIVCDGFPERSNFDIAILAGMGTKTIKHILENNSSCPKLIIQSNKDLSNLRAFMQDKGYKIKQEIVVFDKKYYSIIEYIKGKDNLTFAEILFGKSNNSAYYQYLKNKYHDLYQKSKKEEYLNYENILDQIIEKRQVKKN